MKNKKIISVIAIILALLMLITLVVGILPASVFADGEEDYSVNTQASLAELEARKEELAGKAEESREKINKLQENQAALIDQKAAYDERDTYIREQIVLTDEQIELYQSLIDKKQEEVDAAKALEDRQLERYRTRVRAMEENGEYDVLGVILKADSLSSLLSIFDDMRDIMASDRRLEDQYIAAREEHERIRAEYEAEKEKYDAKMAELKDEEAQLKADIKETEELMEKLAAEIEVNAAEYEAAMNAIAAADRAIDAKIAQLYAAYLASQAAQTAQSGQSGETAQSSGTEQESGTEQSTGTEQEGVAADGSGAPDVGEYSSSGTTLGWPVPGCYNVSSDYGTRTHPITGEVSRMHYGMDIDGYGHDGGDIVSCGDGVVTEVGYNNGYGNYIVVDHGNGVQTLYAHMSGTAVSEGTAVNQGETIGYLGSTGMSTGTHCHLEVFVDGENVDPADYVGD